MARSPSQRTIRRRHRRGQARTTRRGVLDACCGSVNAVIVQPGPNATDGDVEVQGDGSGLHLVRAIDLGDGMTALTDVDTIEQGVDPGLLVETPVDFGQVVVCWTGPARVSGEPGDA